MPFITIPVHDFLLPGCSSRKELDEALMSYKTSLSGLSQKPDLQKYMALLETSLFLPDMKDGEVSLLSGLHSLELLKNSVLIVESYTLTAIAKK